MARIFAGTWMVCFSLIFFNLPVTSILRVFNPVLLWLTPDNLLILENPHEALMLADAIIVFTSMLFIKVMTSSNLLASPSMVPLIATAGRSFGLRWLDQISQRYLPGFFLEFVKEHSGCPILLRTDCGTENGIMATMQCFVTQDGNDEFAGEKAHKYGSSPSNQRIECWWSSSVMGEHDGGSTCSKIWFILVYLT